MGAKFVLRTAAGAEYPVRGETRIGRAANCQIRVDDTSLSPHHATAWEADDALWVKDENSLGGVFVNDSRLEPDRVFRLRGGDRLRLGAGTVEFVAATSLPARSSANPQPAGRRRLLLACATALVAILVLAAIGLFSGRALLNGRLPGFGAPQAQVISVSTPRALLTPQQYADSSAGLAKAIAQLNASELDFIQAANGAASSAPRLALVSSLVPVAGSGPLDDKLRQLAADAFHTAVLADSMSRTMAVQAGGSTEAGRVSGLYNGIAQLGAGLAIEAQNLRVGLSNGSQTPQQAAAVVAEYGARLQNTGTSEAAGAQGVFGQYLEDGVDVPQPELLPAETTTSLVAAIGGPPSSWVAASSGKVTKNISILNPAAAGPDVNDPALLASMSTAAGQSDADAAQGAAAAMLTGGGSTGGSGNSPTGAEVTAAYPSSSAIASPAQAADTGKTLPTFPNGSASAVSQSPGADPLASLIDMAGDGKPTLTAQIPVQEAAPLVNLSITNVRVTGVETKTGSTFEAQATIEYDVSWQTGIKNPQFEIMCSSNQTSTASAASGSVHRVAQALLILYPGNADVYCYASRYGNTWGSTSVLVLVGDASQATRRAEQVETDSVALNITLTVDALQTEQSNVAAAVATQAVLLTENAVSTEVEGTHHADFIATVTRIAYETAVAPPPADTSTPMPTPTFTPELVETLFHAGDEFAVSGSRTLHTGRLYRVCLSGVVNLTTGPAYPSDLESVNGIKVPRSNCVTLEGSEAPATITCGSGEAAEDPGGFTVEIYDLGPW